MRALAVVVLSLFVGLTACAKKEQAAPSEDVAVASGSGAASASAVAPADEAPADDAPTAVAPAAPTNRFGSADPGARAGNLDFEMDEELSADFGFEEEPAAEPAAEAEAAPAPAPAEPAVAAPAAAEPAAPTAPSNGVRLYVGNLSFNTTGDTVREEFSALGEVTDVHVVMDRETGRPRGFAFVTMGSEAEAQKAISEMNGKMVDGRPLRVNEAEERPARQGGAVRGGGGGGGRGGGGRGGGRF